MKVNLFVPCFIDQLYPETAFHVIKLLEFAGVTVHYNPDQTCCGQPAFNSGYWKEARSLAVKFLHDFEKAETIVGPSASCIGYIKNHFHQLFEEDQDYQEKARKIKTSIFELTDFLVNVLKVTDYFGVRFFININNLTDEKYAASAFINPDVINGQPVYLEPGLPRSFSASISFHFD